jgi:methylmalonyl-CoA mutase cobalamin-binding subunit
VAVVAGVVVAVRAGRHDTLPGALAGAVRAYGLGAVAAVAGVATLGSLLLLRGRQLRAV